MNTKKITYFWKNIKFMFLRSWILVRGMYIIITIQTIIKVVQQFSILIFPKYIFDELAGEKRTDITMRYIAIYAIVIIFFNILSLLFNRISTIYKLKADHRISMDNQKKWLFMDYGNFESGKTREIAAKCIDKVNPLKFVENTIQGFLVAFFQLIGYAYIIMSLHPAMIIFIFSAIGLNMLIKKD